MTVEDGFRPVSVIGEHTEFSLRMIGWCFKSTELSQVLMGVEGVRRCRPYGTCVGIDTYDDVDTVKSNVYDIASRLQREKVKQLRLERVAGSSYYAQDNKQKIVVDLSRLEWLSKDDHERVRLNLRAHSAIKGVSAPFNGVIKITPNKPSAALTALKKILAHRAQQTSVSIPEANWE